jgi:hypothetical protein
MIEPFNAWWRKTNHCEPDPKSVEAFSEGFKAGMERGIKEVREIISASKPGADHEKS